MAAEQTGWRRREIPPTEGLVEARDRSGTFFAHGCDVDGTLVLAESIRIDGEFRGTIECKGTVTVAAKGAVEADISARSVEIWGAVVGDVSATREVVLHATAKVHGDIEAPSLVIERGAFVVGATRMFRPSAATRPAAARTADRSPAAQATPPAGPR